MTVQIFCCRITFLLPLLINGVTFPPLPPRSQPVGGLKRSPASRPSSRAESSEDLFSDSASVASDISDSSINSSLPGKRTLAPPTKVTHLLKTGCFIIANLEKFIASTEFFFFY